MIYPSSEQRRIRPRVKLEPEPLSTSSTYTLHYAQGEQVHELDNPLLTFGMPLCPSFSRRDPRSPCEKRCQHGVEASTIPTIKAIFVSVFEEPVSFGDALGLYGGCVV
jgi:hypothetical protein